MDNHTCVQENPSNVAALHVKVSPTLSYNSIEGYDPEDFDRHLTQFKTKHNGGIVLVYCTLKNPSQVSSAIKLTNHRLVP